MLRLWDGMNAASILKTIITLSFLKMHSLTQVTQYQISYLAIFRFFAPKVHFDDIHLNIELKKWITILYWVLVEVQIDQTHRATQPIGGALSIGGGGGVRLLHGEPYRGP